MKAIFIVFILAFYLTSCTPGRLGVYDKGKLVRVASNSKIDNSKINFWVNQLTNKDDHQDLNVLKQYFTSYLDKNISLSEIMNNYPDVKVDMIITPSENIKRTWLLDFSFFAWCGLWPITPWWGTVNLNSNFSISVPNVTSNDFKFNSAVPFSIVLYPYYTAGQVLTKKYAIAYDTLFEQVQRFNFNEFDSLAQHEILNKIQALNTDEAYNDFIAKYPRLNKLKQAKLQYDSLKVFEEPNAYKKAKLLNSSEAFRYYLSKYPNSNNVNQVQLLIDSLSKKEEIAAFEKARTTNTRKSYKNFIDKYPTSDKVKQAQLLINSAKQIDPVLISELEINSKNIKNYSINIIDYQLLDELPIYYNKISKANKGYKIFVTNITFNNSNFAKDGIPSDSVYVTYQNNNEDGLLVDKKAIFYAISIDNKDYNSLSDGVTSFSISKSNKKSDKDSPIISWNRKDGIVKFNTPPTQISFAFVVDTMFAGEMKLHLDKDNYILFSNAENKGLSLFKEVRIKYVKNVKKDDFITDSFIYFAYLDKRSSIWKTDKIKTNSSGFANFKIPIASDGASYNFIFNANKEKFDSNLNDAKNKRKVTLWNIPSNEKSDYIEIWTDIHEINSNKVGTILINQ